MLLYNDICTPLYNPELCFFITDIKSKSQVHGESNLLQLETNTQCTTSESYTAYKPVARKVKPVPGVFPEDAIVRRTMPEDPLLTLLELPTHPPEFIPTSRLTRERLGSLEINSTGFL